VAAIDITTSMGTLCNEYGSQLNSSTFGQGDADVDINAHVGMLTDGGASSVQWKPQAWAERWYRHHDGSLRSDEWRSTAI